ncbi:MAG: MBL fold metallo-hydrolase [Bacilli bacterium]|nr:MBL fold metallo-hydrolase [Bacilli bacterium]
MKKLKTLFCLAALAFMVTSCDVGDFSETTPKDPDVVNPDKPDDPDKPDQPDQPDNPDNPDNPDQPVDPVNPDEEKTLTLDTNNFNKLNYISLVDVVPNATYPEEFTVKKSTGKISSSCIKQVTKIVATAYGTYDNLKVYDKVSGGTEITGTSEANPNYNSATDHIYVFSNGADEFRIENPSSYDVHLYSITIFYKGEISGEMPYVEKEGIININKDTYKKDSRLEVSGVENNDTHLLFKANSFIKSPNLINIVNIEMVNGSTKFSVYGIKDQVETKISWKYDTATSKTTYEFEEKYDGFIIKNETTEDLDCKEFIVTYSGEKEEIVAKEVTIAEAVSIAKGLSRNKGTSEEFYKIKGTVTEINGSITKLTSGDNYIKCYSAEEVKNMYIGYEVTVVGQLQNYYGTPEIINYEVVDFVAVKYELILTETTHGTYEVSKTKDLSYNEEVTITCHPDEGYQVKKILVGTTLVRATNNVGKAKITGNCSVSVEFEEIKEVDPGEITGNGFTIHSLEMNGTYGDCNLIQYGNYDVLVDGGTQADGPYIKNLLNEYLEDGILDLVIISHPDSDHYAGLVSGNGFEGVSEVKRLITNNSHSDNNNIINKVNSLYPNATLEVASELTSPTERVYTINVDNDFSIDIMYNDMFTGSNKNNASIPAIFNYKNTKLFMGGDMEDSSCKQFIKSYPGLFTDDDYVIFKGLHHGSNGSNKDDFISYLNPDLCFVNAPLKTSDPSQTPNFSTHPYLDAMIRMGKATNEVYWAGICGNLTIECDGYKSTVTGATRTRDYKYYNKVDGSYTLVDRKSEANITYFESMMYRMAIENKGAPDYANILGN